MKIRPHIGPSLAACRADEPIFDVGEPEIVGPLVGANRGRVAAVVVGAIDQDAAHAGFAHFAEGDLLGPLLGP